MCLLRCNILPFDSNKYMPLKPSNLIDAVFHQLRALLYNVIRYMYTIFLAFDRVPCQKSNVSFRMYPASILQKFPIWLHCSVHLMQTNLFKLTIIIYIDLCKPIYEIFKDGMGLWAVPHYLIGPNHLFNCDCHLFRHAIC